MTLNLTSIERVPNKKTYRVFPAPNAGYEVVECEFDCSDRVLCRYMKYDDAIMIADALNNKGN